jgi:hypothetical protein
VAAAAGASSSGGSSSSSPQIHTTVDVKVVRWLVVRQLLPDDISALLQEPLLELQRFKDFEQEQKDQAAAAKAGGAKHSKKAFKWSGPPLWWVPYDLFVPEGLGWVGGIALYEFTGQLLGQKGTMAHQQQQQHPAALAEASGFPLLQPNTR